LKYTTQKDKAFCYVGYFTVVPAALSSYDSYSLGGALTIFYKVTKK